MIRYKVTLSNNTTLENLILNGNNFESKSPVPSSVFEDGLDIVKITRYEDDLEPYETIYTNMKLIALMPYLEGSRFILDVMTEDEIWKRKMTSNLDYMAMMADVEL